MKDFVQKNRGMFKLGIIMMGTTAFSQPRIASNQEIISLLLVSPVMSILSDTLSRPESVSVLDQHSEEFTSWLTQNLTDSCLEANYLVYSTPDSQIRPDYIIELSNARVNITYQSQGRRWILVKKGMLRKITGEYHLQIKNSRGRILFSHGMSGEHEDIIPDAALAEIENKRLPFTRGTKMGSTFVKRWMEPLTMTVTTMVVIYLFFTLRGEN